MSVLEVTEEYTGLHLRERADFETGLISGEFERKFCVVFDGNDPIWLRPILATVAQDPTTGLRIPNMWEALDTAYPHIWVRERYPEVGVSAMVWYVFLRYEKVDDPLMIPPIFEFDFATSVEPVTEAFSQADPGDPDHVIYPTQGEMFLIANACGETFDPAPTKEYRDLIIRVRRNMAFYNHVLAAQYIGSVNSDTFLGFSPGKVRLNQWSASPRRYGGMWYWEESLEFVCRTLQSDPLNIGWGLRLLNQGFRKREKDSNGNPTGDYEEILDNNGQPHSEPTLLDALGDPKGSAIPMVFYTFHIYERLPFSIFGLTR